ncbi:phage minor head protein [Hydrocarboniphaga effusa]|uniref:phage minor head protein n=2 Tax=Hydrocarboniphaga effusa TaxID=243629 RepID=UPI003BA9234E
MPAVPNLGYAFGLEPKEAVAYFERLGYKVTDDWMATAEAVRGKAFAAAKSGSLDILKDLKAGLTHAAKTGESEASFIDRMGKLLAEKGWDQNSPSRLKTVFRTNMQSAYMAGRWEQFQASKKSRPYLQYVAVMDAVTRPSHAAMNGLVFHIDDPIWKTHYPPCGYNCRCRVRSHSAASLKAQKLTVRDSTGDTFTEQVNIGKGRKAEVFGYRTPAKPVRVAQRDSAPGEYPKVERGQVMLWEPEHDPKFVDGEGSAWKVENRRVAMRTDPGFGFNQGRWDEAGDRGDVLPGEKPPRGGAGGVVRIVEGQPTWKEAGRPDLRNVAQEARPPAPPLMPAAPSREAAVKSLADVLRVSPEAPIRTVVTPVEAVRVDYELLPHLVAKQSDARERYGLFLLATLADPFEVYLTEYEDGFRTRYIGLFGGAAQLMVVARINRDGTVLWNIMQADEKGLNKQRVGELLYFRKEGQ